MTMRRTARLLQHLHNIALYPDAPGVNDGELLESYLRGKEAAFAALVRRHGPMVWGVCWRVLGHLHDAEDAFQATFLVLVRRAASIQPRQMVGNWLYGVAQQTALKAKATSAKRQRREKHAETMSSMPAREHRSELKDVLDLELSRLPAKYRAVIVLCDLECKTRKEAARQLEMPEGTVASRLATARKMLTTRLARHDLTFTVGAFIGIGPAKVSPSLLGSTIRAAASFAAGNAALKSIVSAEVATLTKGVLQAMLIAKTKSIVAASIVVLGLLSGPAMILTASDKSQAEVPQQNSPERRVPGVPFDLKVGEKYGFLMPNVPLYASNAEEYLVLETPSNNWVKVDFNDHGRTGWLNLNYVVAVVSPKKGDKPKQK